MLACSGGIPFEDYAYDEEGNRLASHLSGLSSSNAHNQLTEDSTWTYAHDARGNRVSRTAKATGAVETYTYDSQNRLVGYASPTTTASYAYDALDRRIAKVVDGVVEAFVHDAWALRSTVASDAALDFEGGALARRWLHSARVDEPLAFERYAGTTAGGSGAAREVFADRLGNVLSLADPATGTVAGSAVYDSFGGQSTTGEAIRYGFTGREHDAETGLIHFRARAYDPGTGMFLQRDPIGFAAGDLNLYAYVWNDPYGWTDPSGLAAAECASGPACNPQGDKVVGAVGVGALSLADKIRALMTLVNIVNSVGEDGEGNVAQPAEGSPSQAESGGDCDPTDPMCEDDDEDEDNRYGSEQDAKDAKPAGSNKKANDIAKRLDYEDAHELKRHGSE